jgi:hypothetical protein
MGAKRFAGVNGVGANHRFLKANVHKQYPQTHKIIIIIIIAWR